MRSLYDPHGRKWTRRLTRGLCSTVLQGEGFDIVRYRSRDQYDNADRQPIHARVADTARFAQPTMNYVEQYRASIPAWGDV